MVKKWLSAPFRRYFNVRFESIASDIRSVRNDSDRVTATVHGLDQRLLDLTEQVATIRAELLERDERTAHLISVLGRAVDGFTDDRSGHPDQAASEEPPSSAVTRDRHAPR